MELLRHHGWSEHRKSLYVNALQNVPWFHGCGMAPAFTGGAEDENV